MAEADSGIRQSIRTLAARTCLVVVAAYLAAACGDGGDDAARREASPRKSPSPIGPPVSEFDPTVILPDSAFKKRVQVRIRISGSPDFIAVDFGSVWVTNFFNFTLDRIEPGTNKVSARIPVPRPCTDIDTGFHSVWVPSCDDSAVYRLDPQSNRVLAKIKVTEVIQETGIGVGEGGAWLVTDVSGETLSRIDPKQNKVVESIQVEPGSSVVAVGFGSVWVANSELDTVQRVDPNTSEVLATIPVGDGPRFMSIGEGAVWVTNQISGNVIRIDPDSNQAVADIDIGRAFSGGDIAAGLGSVWAATGDGPLSRIDPSTNTVVEQFESNGADALGIGEDAIWISDHDVTTVWRFPP